MKLRFSLCSRRFVGRERELALLHELLERAASGHGQMVGVVGEAGIGKSRLLTEFRRSLRGKRITYLEGRCLSYGSGMPYLPVRDILYGAFGMTPADQPEEIRAKVYRSPLYMTKISNTLKSNV